MKTLEEKHYDELRGRLEVLGRSVRLRWPAPAHARDEEAAVTAYRRWDAGMPVLCLGVACSPRLLPALRRHGFHWSLRSADTGEEVAGGHEVGRLAVEVPGLAEGEYALILRLGLRVRRPELGRLPPARLAGAPAPDHDLRGETYRVVASFHSPPEDEAQEGGRAAELRRTANGLLTLWVRLTGAAASGRLARFTIHTPPGGELGEASSGFVGTDEHGEGEILLRAFDYRLERKLLPDSPLDLVPVRPEDLRPADRPVLERSRDAAAIGRGALQAALDQLDGVPGA